MKVGIVTHFYKRLNYGGNLQAYALCQAGYKLGYVAEQLCYSWNNDISIHGYSVDFYLK